MKRRKDRRISCEDFVRNVKIVDEESAKNRRIPRIFLELSVVVRTSEFLRCVWSNSLSDVSCETRRNLQASFARRSKFDKLLLLID